MLAIFTLVPSDWTGARWQEAPFYGEVLVRAEDAADARAIASRARTIGSAHFLDEALYRVSEVNYGEDFFAAGPRGLILSVPTRKS